MNKMVTKVDGQDVRCTFTTKNGKEITEERFDKLKIVLDNFDQTQHALLTYKVLEDKAEQMSLDITALGFEIEGKDLELNTFRRNYHILEEKYNELLVERRDFIDRLETAATVQTKLENRLNVYKGILFVIGIVTVIGLIAL